MGNFVYKDFELSIERRGGQRYHAKVLRSLCGEPDIDFKLPFTKLELENFILKIGSAHRAVRRINSPEMQTAREFGARLFDSIFSGDMRSCLISSQNEAAKDGIGLRLKLRLESPELINVPWEFLYDASHARFLALFEKTPIVRYVDVLDRVEPLKITPPLSMLVMISSPEDLPTLDIAREKANLEKAIKELTGDGLIQITWMNQATLPALADELLRRQYNIFHFIGHGGFDEKNQDGILVMEDEIKRSYFVSGERLAILLGNQVSLRMVVLNSCEGGRTSSTDPFAGVATTLVRTGSVSAVVAMQLAITDQAAITFARGLYNALSMGRPVDAAVTQARLAIFADSNDIEWGTPVLYMRSPDGIIFDIETLSQEERENLRLRAQAEENRQDALVDLYEKAVSKLERQEWFSAYDLLLQIRKINPGYRNVADLLTQVKNEQKRSEQKAELLSQGKDSLNKGEWGRAVLVFQQALRVFPEDAEFQKLLAEANYQVNQQAESRRMEEYETRLLSLYNQAASYMKDRDWSGAISILTQASQLDPGYRDVKGMIEKARAEKSKAEQVSTYLAQGKANLGLKEWEQAAGIFTRVLELDPDCGEAKSLLIEVRTGMEEEKTRQAEQARLQRLAEENKRLEEERLQREAVILVQQKEVSAGPVVQKRQAKAKIPVWIWAVGGLALFGIVLGVVFLRPGKPTAGILPANTPSPVLQATQIPPTSPAIANIPILLPTETIPPPSPTSQPEPTLTPTPTSPPALTASAVPSFQAVFKIHSNIRSGPGTVYPILTVITAGTHVQILGRNSAGDWLVFDLPGGKQGWVATSSLQVSFDIQTLPELYAPPPPTATPVPTAPPSSGGHATWTPPK